MVRAGIRVASGCLALLSAVTVTHSFAAGPSVPHLSPLRSAEFSVPPKNVAFLRAGDVTLRASTTDADPVTNDMLDTSALIRYASAAVIQMGAIAGTFKLLDVSGVSAALPTPAVIFLFFFYEH